MIIWVLIGYMFLFIHRPFEVWPVLGAIRLELVYMIGATIIWLASPKTIHLNRLFGVIVLFAATMIMATITGEHYELSEITLLNWLKLLPFYIMVITSIKDEKDLKSIVTGFVIVMFFYMSHSLWEFHNGRHVYRMGIARMVGVDVAHGDPNAFAASVLYSLPLVMIFWSFRTRRLHTYALVSYMVVAFTSILLTGSRGGMLGLILLLMILMAMSQRRLRFALFLVFVVPIAWLLLPEDMQGRYLSIIDDSQSTAGAAGSKESRFFLFNEAIDLWATRPVLGYGPDSFRRVGSTGLAAHTLYGEILAELGVVGVVVLLGFVICISLNYWEARLIWLNANRGEAEENKFCFLLCRAVFISLLLLLVLGVSGHNFYRYTWIWYSAFQAIALNCLRFNKDAVAAERPLVYSSENQVPQVGHYQSA